MPTPIPSLPQAPTLAQRYLLLQYVQSRPAHRAALIRACKADILFFFRWFGFTFDPRLPQAVQPFVPYAFQEELILKLLHSIETGEDLLIEKSRDMGASWCVALVFLYCWLFKPNAQLLMGSRKLALVDTLGDLASLFEKLRFALRHLPAWLRPLGFNPAKHDSALRLLNPATGACVRGEASTADFARGGRYKAILLDEFAFWPDDSSAYAAAGQSSPCRLVVSTPNGKLNRFADLRFGGKTPMLSLHWRQHPHKNEAWYEQQRQRLSVDEVSRELDISYQRQSQSRVYGEFTALHKQKLAYNPNLPVYRIWDFGYISPACLWAQVDDYGRVLILHELLGDHETLGLFAKRVLALSATIFSDVSNWRDLCDPAGKQTSHQSGETAIDQLQRLGVFPIHEVTPIAEGVERVRHLLIEQREGLPALLVDERACPWTVEAFEGGYRYRPSSTGGHGDLILEEHPYEDVMDCLRYLVWHHRHLLLSPAEWAARKLKLNRHAPPLQKNPYTGY